MLRRHMMTSIKSQSVLEDLLADLLADLRYARKHDQLGRLALLAYCDVKGWARRAGKQDVADTALRMFADHPSTTKQDFLQGIDKLIQILQGHEEQIRGRRPMPALAAPKISPHPLHESTSHESQHAAAH